MSPNYQTAADVFHRWRDDVVTGAGPLLYPIGEGDLERIEVGPGLVTLLGGSPGAGKTAFTMQAIVDALRITPELRACVCNVEMTPTVLLDRQLARLSGIDLTTIRHRRFEIRHGERLEQGLNTLETVAERLAFVRPPFNLDNVAATADDFETNLLLLDYIQRIPPPGDHGDRRGSVDATMSFLRQFADQEMAIIVVAAVARSKDTKGRSSYHGDGLNLASFRESSELEFGADDAFILVPDPKETDRVNLRHLKARHAEARDLVMAFDRPHQRFATIAPLGGARPEVQRTLAAIWNRAEAAPEDANNDPGLTT